MKHGQSYRKLKGGRIRSTPEYTAWRNIKYRCTNPDCKMYKHYGARGILMCQRWQDSFLDFLSDVGKRPSTEHSIDRIDNNGNYEPSNCRWATRKEQVANRRQELIIGVKKSEEAKKRMSEAARNASPETRRKRGLAIAAGWMRKRLALNA